MIDWYFFPSVLVFFAVSSWKISSCFKPRQFWSNSSLVDKTTVFPLHSFPPFSFPLHLHRIDFILLFMKKDHSSLCTLLFSCLSPFFNDTNLLCSSFFHSKALWFAHSTVAGMSSHKTNAHTWSQPGHLRDPSLLPFTCLFYPGLFVNTLWRVFLSKSHEDGSKNNPVLLVNA